MNSKKDKMCVLNLLNLFKTLMFKEIQKFKDLENKDSYYVMREDTCIYLKQKYNIEENK